MRKEFQVISDYFSPLAREEGAFKLLDDAAVLNSDYNKQFVVSTDMLVSGVHFFPTDDPEDIASKSIRVNISDIVSKGATPKYYFLSIALPEAIEDDWLKSFSKGLRLTQEKFEVSLMGGDTVSTNGLLTINIVCIGTIDKNKMIRRNGAKIGDDIFVSGFIGDSKIGLEVIRGNITAKDFHKDYFFKKYRYPSPRVSLGPMLIGIATASIDISDGLLSDINHICLASGVKANINSSLLPASKCASDLSIEKNDLLEIMLNGGDDYEILFTSNPKNIEKILSLSKSLDVKVTKIGKIEKGEGVDVFDHNLNKLDLVPGGYEHR